MAQPAAVPAAQKPKFRDMTGTGRYPPTPRFPPLAFYNCVKVADPEALAQIMAADPYFLTQDNGAGAPLHMACTYGRLDMVHHLLNMGAEVNQPDAQGGFTPLHRVAHLAHLDGYLELYELLLSRGADPSILAAGDDPYLAPGPLRPVDMATCPEAAEQLLRLEQRYAATPKARPAHPYVGCWWTLYDYGLEAVQSWPLDYVPDFPEEARRKREAKAAADAKAVKSAHRAAFLKALEEGGPSAARATVLAAKASAAGGSGTGGPAGAKALPVVVPRAAAVGAAGSTLAAPVPPPAAAYVFPGQGAQSVGMLRESQHLPEVQRMLEVAQRVLGFDLLAACLEGPKEQLDSTRVAQPALLVAGLAAAHRHAQKDAQGAAAVSAAAGLSLGEYCALTWAGALTFEDALQVVKVRAEAMSAAAAAGEPHGMLSVVGLADEDLGSLIQRVLQEVQVAGGTVCQIANLLFPQGRVVSGHTAALNRLMELATAQGALKAQMLAVSGAFHTRLMQPASEALAKALQAVPVQAPRVPVVSNVTGEPFPADPDAIRQLLAEQLVQPVQWERTLRRLIADGKARDGGGGVARLVEVGPGQQIKAMVRRLDGAAWGAFANVQP